MGGSNAVEYNIAFEPELTGPITEDSPAAYILLLKLLNLASKSDFMRISDHPTEVIDANPETVH